MQRTWTWASGDEELKLSEKEAMAHISARRVTANVSNTLALWAKECIALLLEIKTRWHELGGLGVSNMGLLETAFSIIAFLFFN